MTSVDPDRLRRFMRLLRLDDHPLSPEAAHLLDGRARARSTGMWLVALVLSVSVLCAVWPLVLDGPVPTSVLIASIAFLACWFARQLIIDRAERALSRGLSVRFTHGVAISTSTLTSTRVLVAAGLLLVLDIAVIVTLFLFAPAERAWLLVALSLVTVASVTWMEHRVLARPAIALDAVTLAADDRLRSHDATQAWNLLALPYAAFLLLMPSDQPIGLWLPAASIAFVVITALLDHGRLRRWDRNRWDPPRSMVRRTGPSSP